MTRTEQADTAVTRVVTCVVDGARNDIRPRRVGKQTHRRTHRRRTEQNHSRVGDTYARQTQQPSVNAADSDRRTVMTHRRPDGRPSPSPTQAVSASDGSHARTKQRHQVQPSQTTLNRRCAVTANSTYAGAKFTGVAPCASQLPLPPTRWLTVTCGS